MNFILYSGTQLLANQWADQYNTHILKTGCYKTVSKDDRQTGDIVAFKRNNNRSGHVCIVSSSPENCIGADKQTVVESSIKSIEDTTDGTTYWRYTC